MDGLLSEFSHYTADGLKTHHKTSLLPAGERLITSLFFGGGTPSLMRPESIRQVIDAARNLGTFDAQTEVTVECNPTSFETPSKALEFFVNLKNAGVTRVSIGVQGLEPDWLAFLGRNHNVTEAFQTLDAAQSTFDNVNTDIIYGLPNQEIAAWERQLKTLAQRGLTHISAYQLTIEKNTRFHHDVKMGLWEPIPNDAEADFFEATQGILATHGYENYEISNFAKPGYACRHNVHVWRYGDYLGIGAGAHGRVTTSDNQVVATQVIRQPDGYLRRTRDGKSPLLSPRALTPTESVQEAFFAGLRLFEGLDLSNLQKRFGLKAYQEAIYEDELMFLTHKTLLEIKGTHLRLTPTGWSRLDAVLARLLRTLPTHSPTGSDITPTSSDAYTGKVTVTFE